MKSTLYLNWIKKKQRYLNKVSDKGTKIPNNSHISFKEENEITYFLKVFFKM